MSEEEFRISLSERTARIETQVGNILESIEYVREFGERLATVDSRSKSNTHRLNEMEEREKDRDRKAMERAAMMATIVSAIIGAGVSPWRRCSLTDYSELIVSIGLVIAEVLAIFYGLNELAMNIAAGLIGYIGRGKLQERKDDVK